MRRSRGFKVGRKLVRVFKWFIHRKKAPPAYRRLHPPAIERNKAISKLCKWGRSIRRGAKELCFFKSGRGYIRIGQEPDQRKRAGVPKGHLAVYVGQREDDTHRFLVPVVYLNHPLFGQLLKEAEELYGFDHPGQITLPCQITEFETLQARIAAGDKCRPRQLHHAVLKCPRF
ncbi:hypothetical protein Nepgr_011348 [Nepenthes gracilis]|uniref:Uncharacterized protein n=1 Tax=Nepenthes gracilis TaxID=150966 RepID=A0AAD3XLW6_NEPGR|nr:hypothetical protein Nepgr_011348 [Nepenthes gracilis]